MRTSLEMVREFHEKFGCPIADDYYQVPPEVKLLRINLLCEEHRELCEALVLGNEVAQLDALTDLQYILDGTRLSLGLTQGVDVCPFVGLTIGGAIEDLAASLHSDDVDDVLISISVAQLAIDVTLGDLDLLEVRDAAFSEVHRSNMSKMGEDGKPVLRADGKVMKGPNYSAPDLQRILDGGGA